MITDINLIEYIWDSLKKKISRKVPINFVISTVWQALPQDHLKNLDESTQLRVLACTAVGWYWRILENP